MFFMHGRHLRNKVTGKVDIWNVRASNRIRFIVNKVVHLEYFSEAEKVTHLVIKEYEQAL